MENTQGKKPAEWFKMLKEPYRSQAIAAINEESVLYRKIVYSLDEAIYCIEFMYNQEFAVIYNSIKAGETTYLEPELIGNTDKLKPEQMESGKWYVIEAKYKWLCKFSRIELDAIFTSMHHSYTTDYKAFVESCIVNTRDVDNIIPATNEEVLKYFPDEKLENVSLINEVNNSQVTEQQNQNESEKVELRPEELVSGEVYTLVNEEFDRKFTFKHKEYVPDVDNPIDYYKMYAHNLNEYHYDSCFSLSCSKIFHATPEEKKLLLGEEEQQNKVEVDWKAKFEEANRLYALEAVKVAKLEAYNDELTEKINQTEIQNNQEKVYFYIEPEFDTLMPINSIDKGLPQIPDGCKIYEAVKIGVKKSVLVNE